MSESGRHPMHPDLLARWVDRLTEQKLLMGSRDAIQSELDAWLSLIWTSAEGDSADQKELERLVALHCRELGYERRPSSAVIMQMVVLEDLIRETPELGEKPLRVVRELTRIAADAQALGQTERLREDFHQRLKETAPVMQIDDTIVGFLIGSMRADLIDALFGRIVREAVRHGHRKVVVDVFGAGDPDDRFWHTIHGLITSTEIPPMEVFISGIAEPEAHAATMAKLELDPTRVHIVRTPDEALRPKA